MLNFNGSEIQHVLFDGLDIDIVNINGVKVFEAVRKTEYDPVLMTRTVTPYGETAALDMDVQEGGHIDTANIITSGSIPVSNISVSGNRLSFKTSSCSKGITGKIQVPVIECKDYFDYLIPIDLDSCTHPSSKLTYHSGSSASCTASGTSAYYTCSCDAANHTLNASGNEISTYIAPLGHSFTSTTIYSESRQLRTAATCTAAATYWRECIRCTVHSTTQYFSSGSALGHNYVNYKCTRCGATQGPTITSQPQNFKVAYGTGVTMSVSATGYNLSYALYRKIIGQGSYSLLARSSSYGYAIYENTQPQGVQYYFVITDGYGNSVTSNTASILPK